MKILLLGEYSRLHNSLKEGLLELGHEVFLAGYGDYFKEFPLDFKFELKYHVGYRKFYKNVIYRLFGIDHHSLYVKRVFSANKDLFSGYDVVQLINENTFKTTSDIEIEILKFIFQNNKKVFLLSCGTDYYSVKFAREKNLKYSILSPLDDKKISEKQARAILKYIAPKHKKVHDYIYQNISGVIASDLDYHLPLKNKSRYLGLIPNPVNIDKLKFERLKAGNKIVIFHGINASNFYKKGHDIFEEALEIIKSRFSEKIEIITVSSLPYEQFITSYDGAHIILDQVYSYDQGYTALEAMAKGKVVFTGAEDIWREHYKVADDVIVINALPDPNYIVEKLTMLIENPEKIVSISQNARSFVEKYHNYKNIAKKYVERWESIS